MKRPLNNFFGNAFHKYIFVACLAVSLILLITSWLCPPPWEIHSSVIQGVGEIFGFAALAEVVTAIDKGLNARVSKGDTSLEINTDEHNNDVPMNEYNG